jgi:hypothetical protein
MLLPIMLVICSDLNMRALAVQVMAGAFFLQTWAEEATASRATSEQQ